jgi:hypothetical protein
LSVEYYSPTIANGWVDKLIIAINTRLQEQDRSDAGKSIEYLKKQVAATSLSDMQVVFYRHRRADEEPYAGRAERGVTAQTFKCREDSTEKSKPKRAIICVLETLLGGVLALFVVVVQRMVAHATHLSGDRSALSAAGMGID